MNAARGGPVEVVARRPLAVRVADGLADLLTAGLLVTGVLWLVARLLAPIFVPVAGAAGGSGPWWGIGLHLLVGGTGQVVRRCRPSAAVGRVGVDVAVVAVVAAVLWFVWGR